tara:strand:- start:65 stop:442 length:378 start_codon:yes stop_codon:yes gene_type:complete
MQIDNNDLNNMKMDNEMGNEMGNETDEKNRINDLIKELEEETDDSINSNYFTDEESKRIDNSKYKYQAVYYICLIIGFYLMFICSEKSYLMLFFEVILNIFYPYIFIPIKLFLCRNKLTRICIPL